MIRILAPTALLVGCLVCLLAPAVAAQDVAHARFHNLRFMEDWSYLADEYASTDHWYPGAKQVELPGGWTADFGGQFRYRFHREYNLALTDGSPRSNSFHLWRTRIHADLRSEDGKRVFIEMRDARVHANSRPARGIDGNNLDFLNGFYEVQSEAGHTVRVGRAELLLGAERLISPLDWANTRRTFDGLNLIFPGEDSKTVAFATRPILVDRRDLDSRDGSQWFTGVYHTQKLDKGRSMDLFALKLNEQDSLFAAGSGRAGDLDLYTLGARAFGKNDDHVDYDAWAAVQMGNVASDDVDAYAWSVAFGKTFPEKPKQPRLGISVDYASGDSNPTDGNMTTFNQLFPLGHKYFGAMDLVGRQNIIDIQPNLSLKLNERVKFRVELHMLQLAKKRDSLYNAGGAPTLTDATGNSGRNVGREIDLAFIVTPENLAPHGKLVFGYSRFTPGAFVDKVGDPTRADFFFAQFLMNF